MSRPNASTWLRRIRSEGKVGSLRRPAISINTFSRAFFACWIRRCRVSSKGRMPLSIASYSCERRSSEFAQPALKRGNLLAIRCRACPNPLASFRQDVGSRCSIPCPGSCIRRLPDQSRDAIGAYPDHPTYKRTKGAHYDFLQYTL